MNSAISCQNIIKTYSTDGQLVTALNGINIEIGLGELMMLVGPSGCGKTTLISIIAGILNQDSGQCLLFGENFQALTNTQQLRFRAHNIGFVFQAYNLLPALNAIENVSVPLIITGTKRAVAEQKAKEILEQMGLSDRMKALPAQLSGGQQQRVAIARALVHSPRLIVCDEPTSALDHKSGHIIMSLLKSIALQHDRALVIVTHDARIFGFADRIAEMDDGHIIKISTTIASSASEAD
ncbi:MAG: ABC transporter ATP-binding protein [Methylovulum sp.]|jgi:putative ABC transport system ATP-binding protein